MGSILTLPVTAKKFYTVDMYKLIPDSPYYSQSRVEAENTGDHSDFRSRLVCIQC
jgi:hypothetical protein